MTRKKLLLSVGLSLVSLTAAANELAPLQTVTSLDLSRYIGRWYEIAKYPNRFQAKCVADTSAVYSLQADGRVKVVNSCRLESGVMDQAIGSARLVGAVGSPKLEVRFAPAWLGFLPFVWGDYWVIDLDADYQLVAVSEPKREYLWVMARTPQVDAAAYQALLLRLQAQGLDTSRLQLTRHSP